jgi:carbamoyl-phosphate synthase large subunit
MKTAELARITGIDPWFIDEIEKIARMEMDLHGRDLAELPRDLLHEAKRLGFADKQLAWLFCCTEDDVRRRRKRLHLEAVFKTVDTCAAEFAAETPYYYSTYEEENEALPSKNKKIIILGGGPNRIGQGIEFDYCCVHGVFALKEEGYEVHMINCNPETVSTDYDITDRLFFEPLTFEDVMRIVENEKPLGVIVQFGGQTPLKLALPLHRAGVRILGTSPDSIDLAEDRKRFGALLRRLRIPHPAFGTAFSGAQAREVARRIGYPVLVRPSYVLGGRGMKIVYDDKMLAEYMREAVSASPEHPVLIDKFLEDAFEFDVDAIYDGHTLFIGGVMQHIEEAGIHSGDSACVLPPYLITREHLEAIREYTHLLARKLKVKGLINIQYAMNMNDGVMQVLEVNPRASRTVPFVSKAVGVPLAKVAAKVMVGRTLKELGLTEQRIPQHISVKEAVLPFNKFADSIVYLGPEMKSTGEVMGIAASFGNAFAKSQLAAGGELPTGGAVFISVNDNDKFRIIPIARDFVELGFKLVGTEGTRRSLLACGIDCGLVYKVGKGDPTLLDLIRRGEVQLIINTPLGKLSRSHEYQIGQLAIAHNVPYITTLSGASAAVRGIMSIKYQMLDTRCLQDYHRNLG